MHMYVGGTNLWWDLPMAYWRAVLLSCFLSLLPQCSWEYELIEEITGEISAGEARYYTIDAHQSVIVAVLSLEGDADIYSSLTVRDPSSENYDYSSVSCGMDAMVIPVEKPAKVHVAVWGHVRHETTSYHLYLITPGKEDFRRYQVWDWDPETNEEKLLIDIDPLVLANDPTLNHLLDTLRGYDGSGKKRQNSTTFRTVLDWTGFLLLKTLEIAVEVLV